MKPLSRVKSLSLFLLLALLWSISFLLIKIGVATIPPMIMVAMRLSIAAIILVAYLYIMGERLPSDPAAWAIFAFIGLFGNVLPFVLISWSEQYINSGLAAIMMGIMPVATAALAHWLIADEPLTPIRALGVALGFSGLIVLVGWQALSGLDALVLAQIATLIGALSYAVTTIFARKKARLPGRVMATGAILTGALMITPLAFIFEQPLQINPSSVSLIAVVMLAILPTAAATLIYFRLLTAIGATSLSQINYLIPVMGTGWGMLFLGEQLSWRALIALVLVLVGITLVNQKKPKE